MLAVVDWLGECFVLRGIIRKRTLCAVNGDRFSIKPREILLHNRGDSIGDGAIEADSVFSMVRMVIMGEHLNAGALRWVVRFATKGERLEQIV